MKITKVVTVAKAGLANARESRDVLEGWACGNKSAMSRAIDRQDCIQGELMTVSTKLQVSKGALTATFDHFKRRSGIVWAAEPSGQKRIRSSL